MFSTRPPADFRIQRMRAADEKSNQMQAYVKVYDALQLSFPVVDTRPRARRVSPQFVHDLPSSPVPFPPQSWKTKEFGAVWEHNNNNMIARNQFKQR